MKRKSIYTGKMVQLSAWTLIILAALLFLYIWKMQAHRGEAIRSNPEAFKSAGYVIDDYIEKESSEQVVPDFSDTSAEMEGVPTEKIIEDGARLSEKPL